MPIHRISVVLAALSIASAACRVRGAGDDDNDLPPVIATLDPDSATVGMDITIAGEHFGATQGTSTVSIAGANAAVVSWSDTTVVVTVPPEAYPGERSIRLTTAVDFDEATLEVVLPARVYVNAAALGGAENAVVVFEVGTDGVLLELVGSPFPTGATRSVLSTGDARSIQVNAVTRRLFVLNEGSVAVFDLDGETGVPEAVVGSPFEIAADAMAVGVAANATGDRLYVADTGGTTSELRTFTVSSLGALTEIESGAGFGADMLLIADGGEQLISVDAGDLWHFTISPGDGTLSQNVDSPYPLSGATNGVALDPDGLTLYVAYEGLDAVVALSLDPDGGAPLFGDQISLGTGSKPDGVAVAPDGSRIYVSLWGSSGIATFSTGAGNELVLEVAGQDITLDEPAASRITTDGRFLFVAGQMGNAIGVFSISPTTGALTTVAGSPFATGVTNGYPDGIAVTP